MFWSREFWVSSLAIAIVFGMPELANLIFPSEKLSWSISRAVSDQSELSQLSKLGD